MRIGIDIDNTLSDIKSEISIALYEYAKSLGKSVGDKPVYIEDVKDDGRIYQEKYNLNYEELMYFMNVIQEKIMANATPRFGVHEVINTLKADKDTIYIITARDKEFHDEPYLLCKSWLDKNNIEYDKIIVNARDKAKICKEEKVDIFVDDQLANCMKVSSEGIKVIRITDYKEKHGDIINKSNWKEIYKYIKELE